MSEIQTYHTLAIGCGSRDNALMKRWVQMQSAIVTEQNFEELTKHQKIYATYYTTRKDNEWRRVKPDEVQQCYIMRIYTAVEMNCNHFLDEGDG